MLQHDSNSRPGLKGCRSGDYRPGPGVLKRSFALSPGANLAAVCLLLFVLVAAAFLPATRNGFVNFDDPEYVTANPHVQSAWALESVRWAFGSAEAGNWHPVTWLSHMLDWHLFGPNAWGHHLTSILLHAANSVLLFVVLRTMTGATGRAWLVAALFGLHPLRVESVAWVAERKDLLSALFFLFALWAYARRAELKPEHSTAKTRERSCYLLALAFFALGLMCKPMLVTLPFVLLLLDYWPLDRLASFTPEPQKARLTPLVIEKAPFLALAAAASVVALAAQGGAQTVEDRFPLSLRLANAAISCCRYLGQMVHPANLCAYYPHPGFWPGELVTPAAGLLVAISVAAWSARRRRPYLTLGWFWFLGTLVPVLGLVQIGGQAMADRYTYIPSMGLFILVVWGVHDLTRWRHGAFVARPLAAIAIIACLILTSRQIRFWQDSETLFRRALAVTEQNSLAHLNLGEALLAREQSEEALSHFRQAIEIDPGSAQAHYNLGVALHKLGRPETAAEEFRQALRFKPDYPEAHFNLGVELAREGRLEEAKREFREVLRLNPDDADARRGLLMVEGMRDSSLPGKARH
jgi:tetratricopeptide (TPR) repeat protein